MRVSFYFYKLSFSFFLCHQEAVSVALEVEFTRFGRPECYYNELPAQLKPKRDKIAKILSDVGMVPTIPEGGYFILADFSSLSK